MSGHAKRGATPAQVLVGIALVAAILALLWIAWRQSGGGEPAAPAVSASSDASALPVPSDRVDPANQGRLVEVSGRLQGTEPPRDEHFGIRAQAGAIALMRAVEMRQWDERCEQESCKYEQVWAGEAIDSSAFRQRQGHDNPQHSPFDGDLFSAAELRLGAFHFDPELAAQVLFDEDAPVALPVRASQLPPNLAATFSDRDGMLYSGDPERPAVGDLRVRYLVIEPLEVSHVRGVQDGQWLKAPPPH